MRQKKSVAGEWSRCGRKTKERARLLDLHTRHKIPAQGFFGFKRARPNSGSTLGVLRSIS